MQYPVGQVPPVTLPLYQYGAHASSIDSACPLERLMGAPPFPESYLWGRWIWPGQAWTVPGGVRHDSKWNTEIRVEEADNQRLTVLVEGRATSYDGTVRMYEWNLTLADEEAPFAKERTLRTGYIDTEANVRWFPSRVVPVHVVSHGHDPLTFEGQSHAVIVAARDENLRYGPGGFVPYDPEPHPLFDVLEAADMAWNLDHDAVRSFKARATDPYLTEATLMVDLEPMMRWELVFGEAGENAVAIRVNATKAPGIGRRSVERDGPHSLAESGAVGRSARYGCSRGRGSRSLGGRCGRFSGSMDPYVPLVANGRG